MLIYGCESWKVYLKILAKLVANAQKQIQLLRKYIQEVNWQRKSMQTQGGEKLKSYEADWVSLVSKNYEIEQTCVYLQDQMKKTVSQLGLATVDVHSITTTKEQKTFLNNILNTKEAEYVNKNNKLM